MSWSALYRRGADGRCTLQQETGLPRGHPLELLTEESFVKLVRFAD